MHEDIYTTLLEAILLSQPLRVLREPLRIAGDACPFSLHLVVGTVQKHAAEETSAVCGWVDFNIVESIRSQFPGQTRFRKKLDGHQGRNQWQSSKDQVLAISNSSMRVRELAQIEFLSWKPMSWELCNDYFQEILQSCSYILVKSCFSANISIPSNQSINWLTCYIICNCNLIYMCSAESPPLHYSLVIRSSAGLLESPALGSMMAKQESHEPGTSHEQAMGNHVAGGTKSCRLR